MKLGSGQWFEIDVKCRAMKTATLKASFIIVLFEFLTFKECQCLDTKNLIQINWDRNRFSQQQCNTQWELCVESLVSA